MSLINSLNQLIPFLGIVNFVALPILLWGATCAQLGRGTGKIGQNIFQLIGYLVIPIAYYLAKDTQYSFFYFLISLGVILFSFITEVAYYASYNEGKNIEVNKENGQTQKQSEILQEDHQIDEHRTEILNKLFFFVVTLHFLGIFAHFAILLSYCQ